MNRKRSQRKAAAAEKKVMVRKATAANRWEAQRLKLERNILTLQENRNMQPENWVQGQLRYFNSLLAQHMATRPKG